MRKSLILPACAAVLLSQAPISAVATDGLGLLSVTISNPWVDSARLSGTSVPVEFTVVIDGAIGSVAWTANGSDVELDSGSGFLCGGSTPGEGLSNGTHTISACTTGDFVHPG
ncbi:MAG: hypothetical protein LBJ08_07910, partial [Bifidobacteriaceae bacterium]|nr:hypothetical protein [Bifidobacteriaceae bacterium]